MKHAAHRVPIADNLVLVPAKSQLAEHFDIVKRDISEVPGVVAVSGGTNDLLHFGSYSTRIQWPGKQQTRILA